MKKQTFIRKILLSVFIFCSSLQAFPQAPAQSTDVMLQAFWWDSFTESRWTNLYAQVAELSSFFDLVWLPPSHNVLSNRDMGYHPTFWFDHNSAFGSQTDLIALNRSFRDNGVRPIADIVINHRNGVSAWMDFPTETYRGVTYQFTPNFIVSDDEVNCPGARDCVGINVPAGTPRATGNPDTGENWHGARDIDHLNDDARRHIRSYMHFLRHELLYDGWRYDFTKGFAARFIQEYNNAAGAFMSVGEYWDGYDRIWAWIQNTNFTSTSFDFPMKYAVNNAFHNNDLRQLVWQEDGANRPAGLIHHRQSRRFAVTFIDNHDTGRQEAGHNHSRFNGNILAAHAFMLSSPGIPCVWLRHWVDHKEQIKPMIAARKAAGIHSESVVTVHASAQNLYAATAQGLHGRVFVRIGTGNHPAPSGFTLVTSGNGYAFYADVPVHLPPAITVSPPGGLHLGGTNVTLTATNNASIFYTLNGTTPTETSTRYTAPIPITVNNTTLRAIAIDSEGRRSGIVTHTYRTEAYGPITVRWRNDLNWTGNMHLYAWDGDGEILGRWPGTVMTAGNDGWFSYTFTGRGYVNIIFAGSGTTRPQTVDIENVTEGVTCFEILTERTGANHRYRIIDCEPTSITETSAIFSIYPTVVENVINIRSDKVIELIQIHNLNGQLMKEIRRPSSEISVANLSAGIYFISVQTLEGTRGYQKFIKK